MDDRISESETPAEEADLLEQSFEAVEKRGTGALEREKTEEGKLQSLAAQDAL